MRKLLKYSKGYGKQAVLGPAFKLIEALLELFVPLVVASIIDKGIGLDDSTYTVYMSLLLVLLGAVGLAFSITAQYFCAKCAVGFTSRLKSAMFKKMQTFSYTDIDNVGTSTMITRMTADSAKVQNGVNLALRLLLRSPFVVFGAAIMAITVDPPSSATFLVIIPLAVVVFGILLITMPMYKRVQSGTDSLLLKTRENLTGVRVIRAFRMEDDEIRGFGGHSDMLSRMQKRVGMVSSLLNPLTYVLINLALLCLINVGAIRVKNDNLSAGEVIALYNYMSQILIELVKLANLIITISKALASANRIADLLDYETTDGVKTEQTESCAQESEYAVELCDVSLKYAGAGEESISNLSLKVKHGQTIGIIGGTGSGKTSLVNLIPGFYKATAGEVLINGKNVKDYSPEQLRSCIGIVPQKAILFKGSIRENMLWGDESADEERINKAIEIAQATEVVKEKGGLDAEIEQGGRNLSGGQRQRLSIARALVKNAPILILDDSASALDYATEAKLRIALAEGTAGTTKFIVSQRASTIMHADNIVVLEDGEAVGIGTHEELMQSCETYRDIYYSQFEDKNGKEGGAKNEG